MLCRVDTTLRGHVRDRAAVIAGRIEPFVGFACERRRTVLTFTLAKWRVRMPAR